jgi:hypothetical protein
MTEKREPGDRHRANQSKTNHEKVYEQLRAWLSDISTPQEIQLLGRNWLVSSDGVEQLSGPPAHVNCKSVLIWYFTYGGEGEPSYEFKPFHGFSQGIFRGGEWDTGTTATLEKFREVSERIGAALIRSGRYSETRLLHALPKIPVLLTYNEADDEFPATLDIKNGANATTFLPFETLGVLNSLIIAEYK